MSPIDESHSGAADRESEGYMPVRQAARKSLAPFGLAVILALAAGIAALVLWRSWDASPEIPDSPP